MTKQTTKQLTLDAAESLLRASINGLNRDFSDITMAMKRFQDKLEGTFRIGRAIMDAAKSKASIVTITEGDK